MGSNLVNPKTAINVVKAINLSKTLRLPKVEQKETSKGQKPVFSVDEEDASASRKSSNGNSSPNTTPKEPEFVDIHPPKTTTTTTNGASNETVHVRVISHELRRGMEELDHLKTVDYAVSSHGYNQSNLASHTTSSSIKEPSSCLILHAHGGGFIAQSSRSHEIYLRPWARELKIPIVSIDYSLAPENPFPKASEECFYVYCWCLLNKEALGWTGEKIICVGDSAGGVLVTNIVQRAIMAGKNPTFFCITVGCL
jgi:acetyl esterase/lipase